MKSPQLEFSIRRRQTGEPSGLELGDLTIVGPGGTATSIGKVPDQGMMIYVSIAHLMTSVADLVEARTGSWFELVGVDSSFSVTFEKRRDGTLAIRHEGVMLAVEAARVVGLRLLSEASRFWKEWPLAPRDSVHDDFRSSHARLAALKN